MMIRYNICLVRRGRQILLLNREKPSWMGCWNGVGGKLYANEDPRTSMIRELGEETGIKEVDLRQLLFKGFLTWSVDGGQFGGSYMYLAEVPDEYVHETPVRTAEGILDWKDIDWIMDLENLGIATNIPQCLAYMLEDAACYEHHCQYSDGTLQQQIITKIDPLTETHEQLRNNYFHETYQLEIHS